LWPLQPILTSPSAYFRAQERSRTALLQRRRRRLRGAKQSLMSTAGTKRTFRSAAELGEAAHTISLTWHADGSGNDRNPKGRDPHCGARSRGPSARAIGRGPTEGREPPKSFVSGLANAYADGGRCRAHVFFTRSDCPPQLWASSRGCITCHPRGVSSARHGRNEVNLPVVPAGTPSARAEAQFVCCRSGRGGFTVLPGELGPVAPDRCRMTASLRATAMYGIAMQVLNRVEPTGPGRSGRRIRKPGALLPATGT
jgi:hypothetical protein